MTRSWKVAAVAVVAVAAFMGGSTLSFGHGGDANAIHVCTQGEGQAILLSSANGSCGSGPTGGSTSALDWSIQGPKGDKGDTGLQGPKGEKGDVGPAAPIPAYFVITATKKLVNGLNTVVAQCPKGSQVLNGAYALPFGFGSFPIAGASHEGPVTTFSVVPWQVVGEGVTPSNGWFVQLYSFDTGTGKFGVKVGTQLTVRALCVVHKLDLDLP